MKTVTDRFLEYVKHHTTSDESVKSCPSTQRQLDFAHFLAEECNQIGLSDISVDENGYVTAYLPATTQKEIPVIGFMRRIIGH